MNREDPAVRSGLGSPTAGPLALVYEPVSGCAEGMVRIPAGGGHCLEGLSEFRVSRLLSAVLEVKPEIGWRLVLFGADVDALGPEKREALRARVAVLPSMGGLLSSLNAWENMVLPLGMHRPLELPRATRGIHDCLGELGVPARDLLEKLPESMTRYEKILTAYVRIVLEQPDLVLSENLHEGLDDQQRDVVARFPEVYEARCPGGTFAVLRAVAPGSRDS